MSYILDALRRAEADRERERGQVPGLHTQALSGSAAAPVAGPRRWLPWAGGGLLLLAGIGAGIWWASGQQEAASPLALPVPQPAPAPVPTEAATAPPAMQPAAQPAVSMPMPQPAASASPYLPPAPPPGAAAVAPAPAFCGCRQAGTGSRRTARIGRASGRSSHPAAGRAAREHAPRVCPNSQSAARSIRTTRPAAS